jgi:hypothetical protein
LRWQSDADSNAYANSNTDANPDSDANTYSNTDTDTDSNAHADASACTERAEQSQWKCRIDDSDQPVVDGQFQQRAGLPDRALYGE